ncbi:MAG: glycosyltransferase family 1 protein [Hymenobacter sp.]|nr:MAG: glycosyltransferase family 1 protein [Hymenobacter sp.]
MKIVFICGSLEAGRDGVGDYVRRLALELSRQGHEPAGIALNDHHIQEEVSTEQKAAPATLPMLRLPANWPMSRRLRRAQEWTDNFGPEWLSLQFVPFAFHSRGLALSLGKQVARLGRGRSWHLMVHELWVGMDAEAPLKHRWWGKLQRYLIDAMITDLRPKIIHTQTSLYQAQLAKLGYSSYLLPLFANIPNSNLAKLENPLAEESRTISLVIFGSIHAGAPVEQFAQDAAQYARENAVTVKLTMIGRCGKEQETWAASWRAVGLPVEILGEQTPDYISYVLSEASLGVATTPVDVIGKSGTAAAMLEHGLPVLCVAHPWFPIGIPPTQPPSRVSVYKEGNFKTYLIGKARVLSPNPSAEIASKLIESLLAASAH